MENQKVKLMCSYGGKIQLRPHDHQLSYVGGDTKILTVDRNIKFSDMATRLNAMCNFNSEICIKYQLPGEDLDALVSIVDDDDVEQMMFEYDRIQKGSTKPARLRLFLFYPIRVTPPESLLNPDFLFGFDKEYNPNPSVNPNSTATDDLLQLQIPENSVPKNQDSNIGGVTVTAQQIAGGNSGMSRESHVNGGPFGNTVQMVYGVPMMMTGGYHHTGFGPFSAVSARGGGGGGGGQYMEQAVYNFVPATTAVTSVMVPSSEQKMMVSTADTHLSREIKGRSMEFS